MERGRGFIILLITVLIVGLLSAFGWEELTGGFFKSYDIIGDVRPGGPNVPRIAMGGELLDPDLAMLEDYEHYEYIGGEEYSFEQSTSSTDAESQNSENESRDKPNAVNNVKQPKRVYNPGPVLPAGKGFEDYSDNNENIARLKKCLSEANSRKVRIAFLGDSYIEGDILTDGVRQALQSRYGGRGIGYTPVYSEIPGFRRSLVHSCNDFEVLDFRKGGNVNLTLLQGVACRANSGAASSFSGSTRTPHADSWSETTIVASAPNGGQFKVKSGKESGADWVTYSLPASDSLSVIKIQGETSKITLGGITPGVVFEGIYLDGSNGVALDNMSIRGYAGIRHDEIKKSVISQVHDINYDFVVLEFGINALSSAQTNYNAYANKMIKVVEHIKNLYPDAVILIMGIGDRGEKVGTQIHSMSTIPDMIAAQRKVARETGSLFWDTRTAMGGEDAIVEWEKNKQVNKDYIHLSFTGGDRMSKLFMEALDYSLK